MGKFIVYDIIPIVILGVLVTFFFLASPDTGSKPATQILFPVDSLKDSKLDIASHNALLISVLMQREATADALYSSAYAVKTLARSIHIAIIGIILFLTYTRIEKKKLGEILMLLLLPFMFYIDVHLEDQILKMNDKHLETQSAIDQLLNSTQNNTWLAIDYKNSEQQLRELTLKSKLRKVFIASQFNLFRTVLFILPWLVIYISVTFELRKKK